MRGSGENNNEITGGAKSRTTRSKNPKKSSKNTVLSELSKTDEFETQNASKAKHQPKPKSKTNKHPLKQTIKQYKAKRAPKPTDPLLVPLHELSEHHPYTVKHSVRVAQMCVSIGRELGLSSDQLINLQTAAANHDVGKVNIPTEDLDGDKRLSEDEFKAFKAHAEEGEKILREAGFSEDVCRIVRSHHERLDGSGYPDGLTQNDIPLESKIIAACDAFDAMSQPGRNYQKTKTTEETIEEMERCSGTHFDSEVVAALRKVIDGKEYSPRLSQGIIK